ncbi:MAG: MMPL family transporter [Chromatiaceae bacterium]|nr:MMPL family transporter [Chromatiaceae bacterium]
MGENDYTRRYARFMLRHRWAVIFLLFAATIVAAFYVNKIDLRNDPDSLLPLSNRYIATNLYSERIYGMGNLMVWGVKVKDGDIYQPWFIRMLIDLYRDVSHLEYANTDNFIGLPSPRMRNLGLSAQGTLDFTRLIPGNGLSNDPDELKAQMAFLRAGLERHLVMEPLLIYYEDADGNKCELLDGDGRITNASIAHVHAQCMAKGTFIVGDFGDSMKEHHLEWIAAVQTLMADYQARYGERVEFLISGEPYFLATMVRELWDKAWLFGISLLIVLVVLWYQFRHWSCAVLPLLGVGMTIVLTLGLMGYTQFRLTTMMMLTPMLLLAIGIGHAMQITRRFMQELRHCGDPEIAAEVALSRTMIPAALSIGTDLHGFLAISFVDISFYKAYAYFGIFGMSTLILTTTTLIPLLMVTRPPKLHNHEDQRHWEARLAVGITKMLTGRLKWIPVAVVIGVLWGSAHYAELGRGVSAILAGEAGRKDPEIARIQDEFDIMPGAEKGIHYPRAAFKDHYALGDWFGTGGEVQTIAQLDTLSRMMPGVITANMVIRSKSGTLPPCDAGAWDKTGERIIGPDKCFDELNDPPRGIFNDATVLNALSEFEDWLRAHPNIGFTSSFVQFVKTANMMLNAPPGAEPTEHMNLFAIPTVEHTSANRYAYATPDDPDYLPDPNAAVQLYNGILLASAGSGELDSFVNVQNWDEGIIVAFVNTMNPVKAHQTIVDIQNYLAAHKDDPGMRKLRVGIDGGERIVLPGSEGKTSIVTVDTIPGRAAIGGFLGVTEATRDVAFEEWLQAPAATSMTVFAMTAIMFRSWLIAGILVSLCFITLMSQYGLGGYMTSIQEWSANLAFHVQVALSIAMGLGIDYGVYVVARLREEIHDAGHSWRIGLYNTLNSTGSAIIISVVVLLGSLIPLMNTELANLWSVSLYIGEALVLDVVLALMLLPLLLYWFKPRFVFAPPPKDRAGVC